MRWSRDRADCRGAPRVSRVSDAGRAGRRPCDVSLAIAPAEYIGVVGPSGCGKSTLLHVLGCVDTPTTGEVRFQSKDVGALPDAERSRLRLREIGFVFQRFFLLPMLTASENVELPQAEAGVSRAERRERTRELLEYVGLRTRARRIGRRSSRAARCSGSRSRVRLPTGRALLLADEPTGELDQATGEQIVSLLDRLHAQGTAVVVVTHDHGGRSARAPADSRCATAASSRTRRDDPAAGAAGRCCHTRCEAPCSRAGSAWASL